MSAPINLLAEIIPPPSSIVSTIAIRYLKLLINLHIFYGIKNTNLSAYIVPKNDNTKAGSSQLIAPVPLYDSLFRTTLLLIPVIGRLPISLLADIGFLPRPNLTNVNCANCITHSNLWLKLTLCGRTDFGPTIVAWHQITTCHNALRRLKLEKAVN